MVAMRDFEKVTIEELRALLSYDAETGEVRWRSRDRSMFLSDGACKYWNEQNAGRVISSVDKEGYGRLCVINGRDVDLALHRVAWVLHYGEWPADILDHINGVKADNRIENLRVVTNSGNLTNKALYRKNQSGFPGVRRRSIGRCWEVSIGTGGRPLRTTTVCFGKAVRLRKEMERELGYHPNHGRVVAEGVKR